MKTDRKTAPTVTKPKAVRTKARAVPKPASIQIGNLLERVSDGIVAFDAQMNYTYVNQKGGELLGRKPEDLIGKNYWKEYPEAKGTPFANAYVRALETQTPIQIEDYYEPFDRWFENRIYPSKDGLSVFFKDVTEKKKIEQALRESEEYNRALFNQSSIGLALTDLGGKLVDANPAYVNIIGRTLAETLNLTYWDITPDKYVKQEQQQLESLNATGKYGPYEKEYIHKDGHLVPVRLQGLILERGGEKFIWSSAEDISEHQQAEDRLKKSEALYHELAETAQDLIWQCDAEGRYTYLNPAWEQVFGYKIKDMLGKRFSDFQTPEYAERDLKEFARLLKGNTVKGLETVHLGKDGREIHLVFNAKFLVDGQGNAAGTRGTAYDITERVQAEEALRASEARIRSVFEQANDGIYIISAENRYLDANERGLELLGYSRDELLQMGVADVLAPEEVARLAVEPPRMMSGIPHFAEWEHVRKDGTKFPGEVSARRLDETSYLAIVRDLTERRQAEKLLAGEKKVLEMIARGETLSQILETIARSIEAQSRGLFCTILLLDPDGIHVRHGAAPSLPESFARAIDGQPIGPNAGSCGTAAYRKEPVYVSDIASDPLWIDYREVALKHGLRACWSTPILTSDGKVLGTFAMYYGEPRSPEQSDLHLIELATNLTEIAIVRKRVEEQLRTLNAELELRVLERTAQLSAANKELESFSYSVSHDLRAPLRAVSGFAEIIARRHLASLNEEGQHYFENIVQASERMGHLIDDLLNYSRLGRAGVRLEPVSLAGVLAELAKDLKGHIDELQGTISITEGLPDVTGDRTLLSQIFTNLLENAFKYHKTNVPPQIIIDWQTDGEDVILRVSDNGIGIPAEYQDKIFDIFQRLHSEEEYAGTGVGLATVKKSVELLGGNVWVESKAGKGSTFSIRLRKV